MNDYVSPKVKNHFADGAGHCTDMIYIFGNVFIPEDFTDPIYVKLKDQVLDIFENFVKSGVPKNSKLTLKKAGNGTVPFAYIRSDISLENNLWPERIDFWNQIMEEYDFDWIFHKWVKKI